MKLEWGQIVTQIIGFLLALWLLRKYAWGSLLNFIEHRRATIQSSFDEIEQTKAEAEGFKAQFQTELDSIEDTRREMIQAAAGEAQKLSTDITNDAQDKARVTREKARQDIEIETDKAYATLRNWVVDAVIGTSEKVIRERLDRESHEKLINDFIDEMHFDKAGPAE